MFPDNDWYGHRSILHKYIDQKDKKIFASLQHGWVSQYITTKYRKSFYPRLVWSNKNISASENSGNKNIIAIGSPFLYLCKFYKKRLKKKVRGTIIFLPHSTQDAHVKFDHKKIIKGITKKFKKPYTVCFYYYDFKKKNTFEYKKKKWRVICCVKNRNDKEALYSLYDEINNHNHVVCGEFNTALFYGMYLKKKTSILYDGNLNFSSYDHIAKAQMNMYKQNYPKLFINFLNPKIGYELAKKELGHTMLKSKEELKRILGHTSIIKIFFAEVFAFFYDCKYGKELRQGLDQSKSKLAKYKLTSLNKIKI
jgi:hypothetical protein